MRHEDKRIFLKERRNRDDRNAVRHRIEGLDQIGPEVELDFSGGEQKPVVGIRPALKDRDVEPILRISPIRLGLVESAMLGLGEPVCREGHFVEGGSRHGQERAE